MTPNVLISGDRFIRQRNFKPAEYGRPGWWLLSLSQEGTSHGIEIIEIVEIVQTKTVGTLAIYRRWITDPDGHEYRSRFAPDRKGLNFRNEKILCGTLKQMRLERIGPLSS